jgi:hypothetical protein
MQLVCREKKVTPGDWRSPVVFFPATNCLCTYVRSNDTMEIRVYLAGLNSTIERRLSKLTYSLNTIISHRDQKSGDQVSTSIIKKFNERKFILKITYEMTNCVTISQFSLMFHDNGCFHEEDKKSTVKAEYRIQRSSQYSLMI